MTSHSPVDAIYYSKQTFTPYSPFQSANAFYVWLQPPDLVNAPNIG